MGLMDTNVLSELRLRDRTHARVAAWADLVRATDLFLSVINVLEFEAGALQVARRDAGQVTMLRNWIVGKVNPAFAGHIGPVDFALRSVAHGSMCPTRAPNATP